MNQPDSDRSPSLGRGILDDCIQKAPFGLVITDSFGKILFANDAASEMVGNPPGELIGLSILDLIRPENDLFESDLVSLSDNGINNVMVRIGKEADDSRIADLQVRPGDECIYWYITSITDTRLLETELAVIKLKYQALFDDAILGVFRSTPEGKYLEINNAFARIAGFQTPSEMITSISDIGIQIYVNPDDRVRIKDLLETVGEIRNFEVKIRRKDGEEIWISINAHAVSGPDGIPIWYEGTIEEITDWKRNEALLRETNEYLDNLIHHANVPIIIWDPDLQIVRINHAFELLIGRATDEVTGSSLSVLFPPDQVDRCMRLIRTTGDGVRWETVEIPIMHRDGSVRIAEWNSSTIYGQDGSTPLVTIAQGRDVTIERVLERQKERAAVQIQENIAKLAILNDGIRNPLTIITAYADMADNREVSSRIFEAVTRIDEMVTSLDKEWVHSEKILEYLTRRKEISPEFLLSAQQAERPAVTSPSGTTPPFVREPERVRLVEEIQAQLYTILDSIDAVVYVADLETYDLIYMNKTGRALFGNVTGHKCYLKIQGVPDGPCPFCTNHLLVDENGPTGIHTWEYENPVTRRWFDCRDRAIRWPDGRLVRLEIATDITERKRSEEVIQQNEERLRTVLENLPDGVIIADSRSFRFVYTNPAFSSRVGYSPEEITDMTPADLHPPKDAKMIRATFEAMIKGELTFAPDITVRRKDGSLFSVDIQGVHVDLDGRPSLLAVFTDITYRKHAQEQSLLHLSRVSALLTLLNMIGHPEQEILDYTLEVSLDVATSRYAFIGLLTQDESEMMIHAWSHGAMDVCRVTKAPVHFPVEKAGIWGECIRERKPFVVNSYTAPHQKKHGYPDGHVPIHRFLGVPIMEGARIVAILAVANKDTDYSDDDIEALKTLGNTMWEIIHRNQVELSLRESWERFRKLSDLTSDIAFSCTKTPDGAYSIDWITTAVLDITGYSVRELKDKGCWRCIVHDEDLPIFDRCVTGISPGSSDICELRIIHKDGSIVWLSCRTRCDYDTRNPEVLRLYGGCQNITEDKARSEALYHSETEKRILIETIPDLIWLKDPDGVYLSCNPAFEQFFGASEKEIVGKTDYDFIDPDLADFFRDYDRRAMEADRPSVNEEWLTFAATGYHGLFETIKTPMRDREGRLIGVLGIARDISRRNQAEEALRESEERFRGLFDTISSGVAIYSVMNDGAFGKDYIIQDFNRKALEIEGKIKEEVVGRSLFDLRPAIDEYALIPVFQQVWKTGEPGFHPQKVYIDETYSNWYENRIFRLKSGEIVAIYDDITETKQAEEALRQSEERFRSISEDMPGYICSFIPGGVITYVNQGLATLTGNIPEELIGRIFYEFLEPGEAEQVRGALSSLTPDSPRESHEQTVITPDGTRRYLEWRNRAFFNEEGEITRYLAVGVDITERKQAQQELARSEEKYRSVIENASEGIVVIQDGVITYVNPKAKEMVHSSDEDVIGKPFISFLHPDDQVAAQERHSKRISGISPDPSYDYRIFTRDGRIIWAQISAILISWEGRPATLNFLTDITERKRAEDALSQVNHQLTILSSITRHDITNNISTVLAALALIEMKFSDPQLKEYLGIISSSLDTIITQIEFTRVYETLGVNRPVWQRLETVIPQPKVTDSYRLVAEVSGYSVYADQMLGKVFDNLLDNSLRHGGGVTEIRVHTRLSEDGLVIMWEDDGIGIAKGDKKKIFKRGFGNNTGLGLFLVREILSITGMSIHECGEEGRGVHFEILVPKTGYSYSKRDDPSK